MTFVRSPGVALSTGFRLLEFRVRLRTLAYVDPFSTEADEVVNPVTNTTKRIAPARTVRAFHVKQIMGRIAPTRPGSKRNMPASGKEQVRSRISRSSLRAPTPE